jgi:hypothetical protein
MNIKVSRNPQAVEQGNPGRRFDKSHLGKRFGAWGRVEAINSEDNTADVFLDDGSFLNNVPVVSKEWVIWSDDAEKEFNSGERDLPPVQARVFVFMPTFTFADCFIAPFSGFDNTDKNISEPFLKEEKENIKERITPSGWHITDDYYTGSHKAVSPDKETSIEIDYGCEEEPKEENPEFHLELFEELNIGLIKDKSYEARLFDELAIEHKKGESYKARLFDELTVEHEKEKSCKANIFDELIIEHQKGESYSARLFDELTIEHEKNKACTVKLFDELEIAHEKEKSCVVKIFDTELIIEKGKVTVKPKETTIDIDGNAKIIVKGDTAIEASGNIDVSGEKDVTVKAMATLTLETGDAAAFCPNIIPACPLGPVHGGIPAGIIKLRGA